MENSNTATQDNSINLYKVTYKLCRDLEKELHNKLHKRIEVVTCKTSFGKGIKYSIDVRIYFPNNLDYNTLAIEYTPDITLEQCVNQIMDMFNDPSFDFTYNNRFMEKTTLSIKEKLVQTWLEATGLEDTFLVIDGIVCTAMDEMNYTDEHDIYIEDCTLTFRQNTCILSGKDGKYLLSESGIVELPKSLEQRYNEMNDQCQCEAETEE